MVGYEIRNTHTLPRAHDYDKDLLYKLKDDTEDILEQVTDLSLNVPILDQSGLIPASYLPSYVDDVLEYPSYNSLPTLGETGKIYVTTDTDLTYRWSGSTYIEISKSIITGVKGDAESDYRVGNVNITAAHIGLANVANIDLSKAIKTITRSGTTFTYTCLDGTTGTFTQLDNNTTYSAGTGLSLTNTTFALALTKNLVTDALGYTPPTTDHTYNFAGVSFTSGQSSTGEHNANNITSNGVWYYTSNGPATSLGASTTDGALYSQAYSTSWVGQIAQDYRNGRLFVRGKNNNSWLSWLRVALTGESLPASDVYAWAKASTKPSYSWSEITSKPTIPTKTSQLTNDSGFITSGSYLPLSGGTLSGSNNVLNIKSATSNVWIYFYINSTAKAAAGYYSNLAFISNETTYARIGVADDGTPQYWPNATGATKYTLLHTGNLATAGYLPLTGGTISGDLAITGKCTNTAGAGSAFRWGGSGGPHYIGNNGTEAYFYSGNSLGLGLATGGSWRLYITNGGTVGIATTSPPSGYKLYVSGGAGGTSPWGNTSDMKLKNVIGDITTTFELIANAPIFKYKWKDTNIDDDIHIGTSALYWKEIAKEITSTGSDDIVSMEYGTAALVASVVTAKKVKEQETRIQTLELEIEALKAELNNLKNK